MALHVLRAVGVGMTSTTAIGMICRPGTSFNADASGVMRWHASTHARDRSTDESSELSPIRLAAPASVSATSAHCAALSDVRALTYECEAQAGRAG